MPPKKGKSKEALVEVSTPPEFIQPKAIGARAVKTTATSSRPKRSPVVKEAAEVPSAAAAKRTKSQHAKGTAASKLTKRAADSTETFNGEVKTKRSKTNMKQAVAPAKVSANTSRSISKSKAKLPPFVKANSSTKRPVGRLRGRPPKVTPKSSSNDNLPKTPEPKTPDTFSDVDISSILPAKLRRGSAFSVEITKKENNDDEKSGEEIADGLEIEDEEGDDRAYWLMKAEPESRIEKGIDVKFSIDDLKNVKEPEPWNGVRNFAARNNMRLMRKGELAFFYHSNCKVPGVAGIMRIVQEHSVDKSALDPDHPYYDPKATEDNPRWEVVHVEMKRKFKEIVPLKELKKFAVPGGGLEKMATLKQSRLSVSKVSKDEWDLIVHLADKLEAEMTVIDPQLKASTSDNDLTLGSVGTAA
ncbi:MAG: hypothetical protein M1835_002090 [Candelina submexicana]|nr:MAG: hypothetical protein M1835_002090 [Candelina submexicana]